MVFVGIAIFVFFNKIPKNDRAYVVSTPTPNDTLGNWVGDGCVQKLAKPIEVEWEGEVIAQMVSGTQYGIRKTPEDKENPYFYAGFPDDKVDQVWAVKKEAGLTGLVRVKGQFVGITDAYKNTIFGRCVPHVRIDTIVKL